MTCVYYFHSETIHKKPSLVVTLEECCMIIGHLVLTATGTDGIKYYLGLKLLLLVDKT